MAKLLFLILLITSHSALAQPGLFKSLGITPKYIKTYPPELQGADPLEPEIYLLSVSLGRLTRRQFNTLHAHFKRQSHVRYSPDTEYTLEDFLPPVIQALLNKKYLSKDVFTPQQMDQLSAKKAKGAELKIRYFSGSDGIISAANCIGTAMEVTRVVRSQSGHGAYSFYFPGRQEASEILKNPKIVNTVSARELRFLDMALFTVKNEVFGPQVLHVAINILPGLYFEKRDTGAHEPYRLVFLTDIKARIRQAAVLNNEQQPILSHARVKNAGLKFLGPRNDLHQIYLDPEGKAEYKILPNWLKNMTLSVQGDEPGSGSGLLYRVVKYDLAEVAIDPRTGHGQVLRSEQLKSFQPGKSEKKVSCLYFLVE